MSEAVRLSGIEADANPQLAEQLAAWQADRDQQQVATTIQSHRRPSASGTLGSLLLNSSTGDYYDF